LVYCVKLYLLIDFILFKYYQLLLDVVF